MISKIEYGCRGVITDFKAKKYAKSCKDKDKSNDKQLPTRV